MEKGRVKWFNLEKGFGFIERPEHPDLFIHIGDRLCRRFKADKSGEPKFIGSGKPWRLMEDRLPRREGGDWVYYEIAVSTRGQKPGTPKAVEWDFADDYDQAKYESSILAGQPKLPMPFEVAAKLLAECHFDCLCDRAFGGEEFGWSKNGQEIARGCSSRLEYSVWIEETPFYAATDFGGKEAQRLYDARGKTVNVDYNDAGDPREW